MGKVVNSPTSSTEDVGVIIIYGFPLANKALCIIIIIITVSKMTKQQMIKGIRQNLSPTSSTEDVDKNLTSS